MTLAAKIKHSRLEASQTEMENVLSFMSKGFCYLPESRMSTAELLEDALFKAVMQIGQPCNSNILVFLTSTLNHCCHLYTFFRQEAYLILKNSSHSKKEIGGTLTKKNKQKDTNESVKGPCRYRR